MKNLLLGISKANNHLLKEISIQDALNLCIADLGIHQNIDRCYIFKNEDVQLLYTNEWCNNGVESYLGNPDLNGCTYEDFPGLFETLVKDKPLYGLVKESTNPYFKEIMEMQGIKAYLFTPIFSNNQFWGWIGYDDCKTEKIWIDEEVYALHAVAKNIGIRLDHDKIDAKLAAHQKSFDFYLKGSNQGMWEWDFLTKKTSYFYNSFQILGYEQDEIEHNANFWQENMHPKDHIEIQINLEKYISGVINNYDGIIRMKHKKEHYVWIKYSGLIIKDNDGNPSKIIGSHIDISALKEKEQQLEQSEIKYRFITENTTDLICQHYNNGTFSYVSNSSEDITGYTAEELIHKKPSDFIHPEDLFLMQNTYQQIVKKLNPANVTFRFRKKNNTYIWMESSSKVILNETDEIIGMQSSSRDITERIKVNEELKVNLLKEKELIEMKSKFVAMASHQFKTPLTIIYSNAELLDFKSKKCENELAEQVNQITTRIKNEVDRLTELMNNILIFGEFEIAETKKDNNIIDLKYFINKIIGTYFDNEADGRKIGICFKGKEIKINTDETLLTHIVMNLISNSFKYSKNNKNPKLIISYLATEIKFEAIDYGIGIPKQELPHIFNSFFRASNTSTIVGSGLGLTIVKQFTEQLNGEIAIKSKENSGTTVTLLLPYA